MNLAKLAKLAKDMEMQRQMMYEAAWKYSERGELITPLIGPENKLAKTGHGKAPILNEWQKATEPLTKDECKKYFLNSSNNIGMLTGRVNNVTVIDIDISEAIKALFGNTEITTKCVKHTEGRIHIYYKYVPDLPSSKFKEIGFEIKNDGMQVVVPPSIHQDGHSYQSNDAEIEEMPLFLKKKLLLLCKKTDRNDDIVIPECTGDIIDGIPEYLEPCHNAIKQLYIDRPYIHEKEGGDNCRDFMLVVTSELINKKLSDEDIHDFWKHLIPKRYNKNKTAKEISNLKKHQSYKYGVDWCADNELKKNLPDHLQKYLTIKDVNNCNRYKLRRYVDRENCPYGYNVNRNGIWRIHPVSPRNKKEWKEKICSKPLKLVEMYENIETGHIRYKIKFPVYNPQGRVKSKDVIIDGEDLFRRKGLETLNSYGLTINLESDAREMCAFLSKYVSKKGLSPKIDYDTFGWKKNGFVFGGKLYTETGIKNIIFSDQDILEKYKPKGTVKGWVRSVKRILRYNNVRFTFYCAVLPLILAVIKKESHSFLDTAKGKTSMGKTSKAKAAMSMYGEPQGLKLSSHTTFYLESILSKTSDTPVFIDEIQTIGEKEAENIAYFIANGTGKGRGTKDLELKEIKHWNTVALMTGEASLLGRNSKLGAEIRLTEVDHGIGEIDSKAVEKFAGNKKLENNYGVFAPELIEYIVANRQDIIDEHAKNEAVINKIGSTLTYDNAEATTQVNRLSSIFSSIITAGYVFEKVYESCGGKRHNHKEIVTTEFTTQISGKESWDTANKAMNSIREFVSAHRKYFVTDSGTTYTDKDGEEREVLPDESVTYENYGKITDKFYAIYPDRLEKLLADSSFDIKTVLKQFKDHKWLVREKNYRGYKKRVSISGSKIPMYCIVREVIDNDSP